MYTAKSKIHLNIHLFCPVSMISNINVCAPVHCILLSQKWTLPIWTKRTPIYLQITNRKGCYHIFAFWIWEITCFWTTPTIISGSRSTVFPLPKCKQSPVRPSIAYSSLSNSVTDSPFVCKLSEIESKVVATKTKTKDRERKADKQMWSKIVENLWLKRNVISKNVLNSVLESVI